MPGQAVSGIVHAPADAVAKLRNTLDTNPEFRKEIAANPQSALQKVGITVDGAVAKNIQQQLSGLHPGQKVGVIQVTAIV